MLYPLKWKTIKYFCQPKPMFLKQEVSIIRVGCIFLYLFTFRGEELVKYERLWRVEPARLRLCFTEQQCPTSFRAGTKHMPNT